MKDKLIKLFDNFYFFYGVLLAIYLVWVFNNNIKYNKAESDCYCRAHTKEQIKRCRFLYEQNKDNDVGQ
jgi:hypothetical protein